MATNSEDVVVTISPEREKFFGRAGRLLKPCPATVAALIREIPEGKLITTELLRGELARRHGADVTCPSDTLQALRAIGQDADGDAPYWRVVQADGSLLGRFPGGRDGHAARLAAEGFAVDTAGKTPRVTDVKNRLADFV